MSPHHHPTEFPPAHPLCEDAQSCKAAALLARAERAEAERDDERAKHEDDLQLIGELELALATIKERADAELAKLQADFDEMAACHHVCTDHLEPLLDEAIGLVDTCAKALAEAKTHQSVSRARGDHWCSNESEAAEWVASGLDEAREFLARPEIAKRAKPEAQPAPGA